MFRKFFDPPDLRCKIQGGAVLHSLTEIFLFCRFCTDHVSSTATIFCFYNILLYFVSHLFLVRNSELISKLPRLLIYIFTFCRLCTTTSSSTANMMMLPPPSARDVHQVHPVCQHADYQDTADHAVDASDSAVQADTADDAACDCLHLVRLAERQRFRTPHAPSGLHLRSPPSPAYRCVNSLTRFAFTPDTTAAWAFPPIAQIWRPRRVYFMIYQVTSPRMIRMITGIGTIPMLPPPTLVNFSRQPADRFPFAMYSASPSAASVCPASR